MEGETRDGKTERGRDGKWEVLREKEAKGEGVGRVLPPPPPH